jgi:hypothetical protein
MIAGGFYELVDLLSFGLGGVSMSSVFISLG